MLIDTEIELKKENILGYCQSPIEEQLAQGMLVYDLSPIPQYVIPLGSFYTISDFAFPDKKVAIYCDGYKFHSSKDDLRRDYRVTRRLQLRNWMVLRFTGSEIRNTTYQCVQEIRQGLTIHG